jgi:uncharacterized protein (DUF4415 family)
MMTGRTVIRDWGDLREGKTDWARVDALTEADLEKAVADDPDWAGTETIDWSKATVVYPAEKMAISIRVDQDVLTFFKEAGPGYQTRINAVLRSFMEQTRKVG